MKQQTCLLAGLAGLLANTAGAQSFTELIREGDPVPGATSGELVNNIDNVDINNAGDWLIELNGDGDSTGDHYMLFNGNIIWQEGTSLGFTPPAGMEAGSFIDVMDINDNGDILFITPVRDVGTTSNSGSLTVWNGITIFEAGVTVSAEPTLPAGTIYDSISEVWQNNNRQLLVIGNMLIGGTATTETAVMRVDIDAAGNIINEVKLALEGETLPGPNHVTPIQGFSASKGRQAINDNGDCIWYVDDDHTVAPGSTLSDANMYTTDAAFNNTLLYNEADAFPTDPADVFDHFSTAEVDLNNNGDFVFSGFDRGPSTDDSWIFKSIGGVITVIAHEGDPVPASVPGPWLVAGFGFGGVVPMSNSGDVLWMLDWDDPDTDIDTGLMFNENMLIQEGVTLLSGLVVGDVPNGDTEVAMNDDGTLAIIEVVLEPSLDAVFIVEFDGQIGSDYCSPANVNSTGIPTVLTAVGSDIASANSVTLVAEDMPLNQFGYFLNSQTQGFVANPNNSEGNLCLSGNIGRYNTQVFSSGASGSSSLTLDLPNTPQPTGNVSIMAGQTWNFQCWHRDANPAPTSNFSQGVSIVFN